MMNYAVDGDGIASITWNVTNRSMNVMNEESLAAYEEAMEKAPADDAVKGVILASARREFIAGADLEAIGEMAGGVQDLLDFVTRIQALFRRAETSGKPFVAALNGHALGGGLEIALACHHPITADSPNFKVGLPEAKVGLLPGGGGTQRLPRMIGIKAALPLLLEGRELSQQAAHKAGIIDQLVPASELLAAAKKWLLRSGVKDPRQPWDKKGYKIPGGDSNRPANVQAFTVGNALLRKKTYGNFPAPRHIMSSVFEGCAVDIDTGLKIEARYLAATAATPECANLIRLFFSTNAANKLSRRPADVPRFAPQKIAILGAGMMGAGIAYVSALAGIDVVLLDSDPALAEKGKSYSENLLQARVEKGHMTAGAASALLAKITPITDYADLAGAELVIEAVFEDREIKAQVTRAAETQLGPDAIFASNTSTLPITGLAKASARPANFIGLHFFSPVDRMPLVEVIRGSETSDVTLARAMDYVKAIRKTPIIVNDARGFYTSRVFATYVREGIALLAEGAAPALIENAGRMAGMPVGPLALADEVSLDLMFKITKQTAIDLGEKYIATPADATVQRMVEALARPGKKAGKGFYDYPKAGKKHLWPGLAEEFPLAGAQPNVDEVIKRLMYIQSVETARCMAEEVITSPREADVGSILGWGFAPARGGAVSQIDMVGVAEFVRECDRLAQQYGSPFSAPQLLRDMATRGESFYGTKAA